jgi:septal ring factor EnvC (AmiA/AmiB activator)
MEPTESARTHRQVLPWLVVALIVVLAGGMFVWMNNRIDALQAATAIRRDSGVEQTKRAVAALEQTVKDIQSSQQSLVDRIAEVQRKIASEGSNRKLMSDQLGALGARVDGLASANAESAATARQNSRTKR